MNPKQMVASRMSALAVVCCLLISPAFAQFDKVINVPPDNAPHSLPENTQLNLFTGGELPNPFSAGEVSRKNNNIEVNIFGGFAFYNFDSYGATVNFDGGQIGSSFTRFFAKQNSNVFVNEGNFVGKFMSEDSIVSVSGGTFNSDVNIRDSHAAISGGTFNGLFTLVGSTAEINGGEFGNETFVNRDCVATITGGTFGRISSYGEQPLYREAISETVLDPLQLRV